MLMQGNWLEFLDMQRFLMDNTSKLEYLGIQGFEGDDNIAALIIYMSKNLTVLDLSETRFALMTTIINGLPTSSTITALDLSAIGGHTTQKLGDMYTNPLMHDTVKLLVDKCRQLTDLIIFGTKLTYDSIEYICNHLTPTILRLNIARERVNNADIKDLTKQCPRLQYLNISETLVDYQAINNIVQGWRYSMINMSLPTRMGFILTLHAEAPSFPRLTQFKSLIDSMPHLKFLHIGHYKFKHTDIMHRRRQVIKLSEMFPHLKFNINPFNTRGPVESDPYFLFKNIGRNRT
jgi:hypothetical protein